MALPDPALLNAGVDALFCFVNVQLFADRVPYGTRSDADRVPNGTRSDADRVPYGTQFTK